ncbi:MAG TPA: GDCCVxC domain-containing (seleno)protein [Burkholderiales bacterium]|nr:GDCCVxC domain-containing (seleno)protein [Burkholderiales bacterium]
MSVKPVLESILTCPECGFSKSETMPLDTCLFFYECGGCKRVLRPKRGDCCVFCSYGSVRCPPEQAKAT